MRSSLTVLPNTRGFWDQDTSQEVLLAETPTPTPKANEQRAQAAAAETAVENLVSPHGYVSY